MNMAIIMQCHRNPEQINKIIDFFDDNEIDIYIHIDKKSNIKKYIKKNKNVNILNNSEDVRWGQYSQVKATLNLIRSVNESKKKYKYIHFISGQDYPIKSLKYIKDFFEKSKVQYIQYYEFPNCELVKEGHDRYEVYYPQWMIDRPKSIIKKIIRVVYREFVLRSKILKRDISKMPKFYGGSSWFSITGDCAEYILKFIDENKEINKFFRNSIYSDEMFFQTIILNSKYKKDVVNDNLRYIDWSEGKESPKSLGKEDIDCAINTSNIFARKIEDLDIIKYIDSKILE